MNHHRINNNIQLISTIAVIMLFATLNNQVHCWKYQTECTNIYQMTNDHQQHDTINRYRRQQLSSSSSARINMLPMASILSIEPQQQDNNNDFQHTNNMLLNCPNSDESIYVGLTQYGVRKQQESDSSSSSNKCLPQEGDCVVPVDYISNQCNGLNNCQIQLDPQYLHSCKNYSNYITIAYKCIPSSNQMDICSNKQVIFNPAYSEVFLKSPNYPNEYDNNIKSCKCSIESDNAKMNLTYQMFEFDVEEGDIGDKNVCNKDKLAINELSLCGQYKEFKEFNTNANKLLINFKTDDAITRRGFLIKFDSVNSDLMCPYDSKYFDSNKCVKQITNKKLTYEKAKLYCEATNGRLLRINNFIENIKFDSLLLTLNQDHHNKQSIWSDVTNNESLRSLINIKETTATALTTTTNKCLAKKDNYWTYELCEEKLTFICEYDRIENAKQRFYKMALANNIKISCGNKIEIQSDTTRPTTTIISSSTTITTQAPTKISSTINSKTTATTTTTTNDINSMMNDDGFINSKLNEENGFSSENTIIMPIDYEHNIHNDNTKSSTKEQQQVNGESSVNKMKNTDFALIIGAVCGLLIVIIFVNIYCIWSIYNRKLNGLMKQQQQQQSEKGSVISNTSHLTNEVIYFPDNFQFVKSNDEKTQTHTPQDQQQPTALLKTFFTHQNGQQQQQQQAQNVIITNSDGTLIPAHVYETIPSVYYYQTTPNGSNSISFDSYISSTCSDTCILTGNNNNSTNDFQLWTTTQPSTILVLSNGRNFYMNSLSPSQSSSTSTSTTSSTQPLTKSEAIV